MLSSPLILTSDRRRRLDAGPSRRGVVRPRRFAPHQGRQAVLVAVAPGEVERGFPIMLRLVRVDCACVKEEANARRVSVRRCDAERGPPLALAIDQ